MANGNRLRTTLADEIMAYEDGTSEIRRYLKTGLTLAVGAVAMWASIGVTLAHVMARQQPGAVLAIWPASSTARANFAFLQFLADPGGEKNTTRSLAREVLARDPLEITAIHTLVLLADDDRRPTQAARLARYAERVTRRHLPTQLWLIEDAVSRGDLDAALRHYDRAMRSSTAQRGILLPVLVDATTTEPLVASAVSHLLASRPPWWADYYSALLDREAPISGLYQTSLALKLNADLPAERALLDRALSSLVVTRRFAEAESLYVAAMNGAAEKAFIRPVRAPGKPALPPFDWLLTDEVGFGAIAEPSPADPAKWAIFLSSENRAAEVAARQLLRLPAGSYRFEMRAGDVVGADASERPRVGVECDGGAPLAKFAVPAVPSAGKLIGFEFTVPAGGCPAQGLTLSPGISQAQSGDERPWFGSFAISRIDGSS